LSYALELSFYQVVLCCTKHQGNTILLKHASIVAKCYRNENLFKEAGAPRIIYKSDDFKKVTLVDDVRIKGFH
jgi:hypothetical protein